VYPKVSGLAAWSENYKWYGCHYVHLYRYFASQSSELCRHSLCVASQLVFIVVSVYFVMDSVRKLLDTPSSYTDETHTTQNSRPVPKYICEL